MTIYDDAAATAGAKLRQYGAAATLVQRTSGAYDPATGASTVTSTNVACTALEVPIRDAEIDGTMVLRGDRKLLLAADDLSVTPRPQDSITFAAETLSVVSTRTLRPDGSTEVLHTVFVRKGA